MQGELNASHTGGRYRPDAAGRRRHRRARLLPRPGVHAATGWRILEVIEGGPLQKAGDQDQGRRGDRGDRRRRRSRAGANWYPLLNRKAGHAGAARPARPDGRAALGGDASSRSPGATQSRLLYQRWVRSRRDEVERLSGGRLGYAHIRGMNDGAYREIFEEIFGRAVDKEAIVLDTRFNGGGNLVEALTVFLSGKVYATATCRAAGRSASSRASAGPSRRSWS